MHISNKGGFACLPARPTEGTNPPKKDQFERLHLN